MLWGSRFIIPSTYRQVILGELHAEHSGISQTNAFEEATSGGMEWMLLSRVWRRNVQLVSQWRINQLWDHCTHGHGPHVYGRDPY